MLHELNQTLPKVPTLEIGNLVTHRSLLDQGTALVITVAQAGLEQYCDIQFDDAAQTVMQAVPADHLTLTGGFAFGPDDLKFAEKAL